MIKYNKYFKKLIIKLNFCITFFINFNNYLNYNYNSLKIKFLFGNFIIF